MKNIPLSQFEIPHPCTQDWSHMRGTAERRFCDVCRKDVHNLARTERGQADALLQHGACVRMERKSDGQVLTLDDFPLPRVRAALNRRGLRFLSRVILVAAPLFFASCRREGRPLGGTPQPSNAAGMGHVVVMGEAAAPANPPATAPAVEGAPDEGVKGTTGDETGETAAAPAPQDCVQDGSCPRSHVP